MLIISLQTNFKTPVTNLRKEKNKKKDWAPPSPFTSMPNYDKMATPVLKVSCLSHVRLNRDCLAFSEWNSIILKKSGKIQC